MRVQDRQCERKCEENSGQPGRKLHQHIRGLCAENILRDAATEGCAKPFALRALHQDHEEHEQRDQDIHREEEIDQNRHWERGIWLKRTEKQTPKVEEQKTPNAQRPTPNVESRVCISAYWALGVECLSGSDR